MSCQQSTRKSDALELERQMRQKMVDTQVLGHPEPIRLYDACVQLRAVSKQSGACRTLVSATNRFEAYFDNRPLDEVTNRDLVRWVELERKRENQDTTIRPWARQC